MGCTRCFEEHPAGKVCPALASRSSREEEALEGQRHGPLLLRRRLGAGALGTVYLAEYAARGHRFAVKALHPHLASRAPVRARFFAAARAAEKLVHPNVARVLDVRPGPQGRPCVLMEYVDGVPLSRLPLPLAPGEAVELLGQALEGLEAAHAQGLVHGGIRPRHLFLARTREGERRVRILDFGLSSALLAGLPEKERVSGPAKVSAYAAPEQEGGDGGARVDLFALAVVGYQLVTGQLPFAAGQALGPPPAPHVLNPCVPQRLSEVLLRALSLQPEARYPDARALRAALADSVVQAPEDAELARILARTASLVEDPYRLLNVAPSADFAEVHRRAEAALRRLDSFRHRPLPVPQHRALEALRARVEAALRTLGNPLARVGFDAVRGNVSGVARCLAAGVSEEEVAPLREAFLAARPGVEARANALFTQGHALEAQRALLPALEMYARALSLDPLNLTWQRHFLSLHRRVRASQAPAHVH